MRVIPHVCAPPCPARTCAGLLSIRIGVVVRCVTPARGEFCAKVNIDNNQIRPMHMFPLRLRFALVPAMLAAVAVPEPCEDPEPNADVRYSRL